MCHSRRKPQSPGRDTNRSDELSPSAGGARKGGRNGGAERRIWFSEGHWWYSSEATAGAVCITEKMRSCGFQGAALAKALGLGERTFHRVVIESLGIPPGRWLRMERAAAAMVRLRTGCPVKELADEFGFRHQGDFAAEFKRWHGVLPSEYQAQVRRDSMRNGSRSC
jgi:AraC-like DNA-binding protein